MNRKLLGISLLLIIVVGITGCIGRLRVGPTQTESRSVELGNAETARVDIKMGVGQLRVNGGAKELLEAEFTYNIEDWDPIVDYDISGSQGRLTIEQPESEFEGIPDNEVEYEWDLLFSDEIPMSMDVDLGVGESNLELSGLSLTGLNISIGVGETTIDLSGDWEESFDVDIRGGVGKSTVILPRDVGVKVDTQTGIGSIDVHGLIRNGNTYTNEAYEGADVILDINVQGGVGSINLELGD